MIITEIFPDYGLLDGEDLHIRVKTIDGKEVLNLQNLWDIIQTFEEQGKKKALLGLSSHHQLPLDLEGAAEVDAKLKEKYGILYMKTPGGFHK